MPGQALLCCLSWSVLLSRLSSHCSCAGEIWEQEGPQPCSSYPQHVGCLGQTVAAASFGGVPLLRAFCCELMADGVGGSMWLHLWLRLPWSLSASEQGIGFSALAQLRALVSCSLRTMYQRTEVNENLPAQNLRKVKRQGCNDASRPGCVYVLCLK